MTDCCGTRDQRLLERRLVTTADGSQSLFLPALGEHYHSSHGALSESRHVFIAHGLGAAKPVRARLQVLEIGFGSGLNALLTWSDCRRRGVAADYTALEPFPLLAGETARLNHADWLDDGDAHEVFVNMHACAWRTPQSFGDSFTLRKLPDLLQEFCPSQAFDLIYFDAFSPQVQPELWTQGVFAKLFACTNRGGLLVTYCAKGEVRRQLRAAGFAVERLPGSPGKREMTRAWKERSAADRARVTS